MSRVYHVYNENGEYSGYRSADAHQDVSGIKISVILPIYNAQSYLDQALDSVQNQVHRNLEIICINDGSTDNSLEIIKQHAACDPRIVIIDKENEGYGASCNRGLDRASGEWISIIEPDDWIEGNMYGEMLAFAMRIDGTYDIIKTPYWRITNPDSAREKKLPCSYTGLIKPKKQPFEVADAPELIGHHPSIWSAIYRKSFLDEKNIRFRPIPGAGWADNPFLIETLLQARGIVYLDKAFYCYRADTPEKEKSFSQSNPTIPFERWDEMSDVIDRLGITDKRILDAHYSRGIMYMSGIIMHNDPNSPEMRKLLKGMFSRMKPELLFANNHISPGCKRLYADVMGLDAPKINPLGYGKSLVDKGLYNLRTTGIAETAIAVGCYFKDHKARIGKK